MAQVATIVSGKSLTMPSRSGYFLFAHFWIHEDEVHRSAAAA